MEAITKSFITDSGEKVEFVRLTLGDLFSLTDIILAEREKIAREVGKEEGLTKIDVINLLLDIRSHKPTVHDMLESCSTAQGAYAVLQKSLAKAGVAAEKQKALLDSISITDCLDIARNLVLDIQEPAKKEEPIPLSSSPTISSPTATDKVSQKIEKVGYYGKDEKTPTGTTSSV